MNARANWPSDADGGAKSARKEVAEDVAHAHGGEAHADAGEARAEELESSRIHRVLLEVWDREERYSAPT